VLDSPLPADHIYIIEEIAFIDAAIEEQRAGIGSSFWSPFRAVGKSRALQWRMILGGLPFLITKWFWYQRHQLLFINRLFEHWYQGNKQRLSYYWYLWCRQNSYHYHLVVVVD
jgi:hypothetical protein